MRLIIGYKERDFNHNFLHLFLLFYYLISFLIFNILSRVIIMVWLQVINGSLLCFLSNRSQHFIYHNLLNSCIIIISASYSLYTFILNKALSFLSRFPLPRHLQDTEIEIMPPIII